MKTKVKTFRIKIETLEQLSELCIKSERKLNWYVQKILDSYLEKIKSQKK